MLQGEAETVAELGALLWPRLASKYVELRLAPRPPADGAQGACCPFSNTSLLLQLSVQFFQSASTLSVWAFPATSC